MLSALRSSVTDLCAKRCRCFRSRMKASHRRSAGTRLPRCHRSRIFFAAHAWFFRHFTTCAHASMLPAAPTLRQRTAILVVSSRRRRKWLHWRCQWFNDRNVAREVMRWTTLDFTARILLADCTPCAHILKAERSCRFHAFIKHLVARRRLHTFSDHMANAQACIAWVHLMTILITIHFWRRSSVLTQDHALNHRA